MKLLSLITVSLLSTTVYAGTIQDASSNKSLQIFCGDNQNGTIKLDVSGKNGRVYINGETRASAATVTEQSNGDYSIQADAYENMIIRLNKEQLHATVYQVYFPPYTEVAVKRVNCTWSRK